MRVVILGGSGIGMLAAHMFQYHSNHKVRGFLNDHEDVGTLIGKHSYKVPVIGRSRDVHKWLEDPDVRVFVAYVGMKVRQGLVEFVESLAIPEDRLLGCIHSTSWIPHACCKIGPGCLIGPHAQLSPDVTLGKNVHVLGHAFVGHDTVVEDYVTLANNTCTGANNTIGRGVFMGTNACTREYTRVRPYTVIGMGAVVLKDTPESAIVVGNPAKPLVSKE